MQKNLFIVVDGPSASGKDSIIKQLVTDLSAMGKTVFSFEETKVLAYDRKKILSAKQAGEKAVAEAILEERKKLYRNIFQQEKTDIIIANRGEPSTLTYQTQHDLSMEEVWDMHRENAIPIPDLVIITNCSPEEAERREKLRNVSDEKSKNQLSGKFTLSLENSLEKRHKIHEQYQQVVTFLKQKSVPVLFIDTDIMNVPEESRKILETIKHIL